ncbi:uncharacterized protein B0P05DRAFT_639055 [Gilbertella persicaria]|uniref:uncharacterized protein n=1 Tax=Gilbertella persicaria TaxID=101096 RepID=UPI00221EA28B|nr:uncharacterized protein B0P05DRAFT_639055 [Gilbertella persicaria]KAI8072249.1 hypothetical protein B0P05DRAFT_639055 [Gilbertella persicaria]
MLSSRISFFLLCFYILQCVQARKDCDPKDPECREDIYSSASASTSTFSIDEALKTLIEAASYETMSNFHEAKVADSRPNSPPKPVHTEPAIQDDYSGDMDSGSDGITEDNTGLSRVETAVLSTCGVLVVAGIAVGLFVWKNTSTRNSANGMSDLEQQYDRENGIVSKEQNLPSVEMVPWKKSVEQDHSSVKPIVIEAITEPAVETDVTEDHELVLTTHHLRNSMYGPMFGGSPELETNIGTTSSATDPAHDPTVLTYPLQKFLKTPTSCQSPVQIAVHLENNQDEEEDEDEQNSFKEDIMYNNKKGPSSLSVQKLSHQLARMFKSSEDAKKNPMLPFKKEKPLKIETNQVLQTSYASSFVSPLDLPEDQYIPMQDAIGLPLVSRAEVLADPLRRLGKDEIALWEENCRKKDNHEQ